ncbi:hypothetical protein VTN77DRAFT_1618 [Rasamsonia byssochlamydoides]|uniref:uncharacterized protein n=1 Tax=Rasamsonia byssochlamydoides TaxID=89139 RepID=UPI0037439821
MANANANTNPASLSAIQQRVWEGRLPLEIVLDPSECRTYDQCDPYLISYPRLSYLPFLLPKLHAFFSSYLIDPDCQPHQGWFSFEGVPLKWHYPVGLLYDLYSGADPISKSRDGAGSGSVMESQILAGEEKPNSPLPWRLTLHFQNWPDEDLVRLDPDGMVMHDAFINSVKEADFLRNGNAKGIMSLSKEDSSGLWKAVQEHDLASYRRITNILLPSSEPFRHVPVRFFLPLPPDSGRPSLKVVQSPLPPTISSSSSSTSASGSSSSSSSTMTTRNTQQPQTIGTALHSLLPNLFPSRRIPVLAKPVLHGVVVPMTAPLEEVVRSSAYGDGWAAIVICMVG